VRPAGVSTLGTKAEVKNINSFRFLEKALEFEIDRQIGVLRAGGSVIQETRLWDAAARQTFSMRSKEEAHDYRYFPEPDLPPLESSAFDLESLRLAVPELPEEKRKRFKKEFLLTDAEVNILAGDRKEAEYFESAVSDLEADLRGFTRGITLNFFCVFLRVFCVVLRALRQCGNARAAGIFQS
jgi:aspartyl-tRNA(Asn)/glutamyl-tRNA(Gln) amidotransferase subunit B